MVTPSSPGQILHPPYRKLRTNAALKQLMKRYYALSRLGPRLGMKTAWLTSGAPVEVVLALGLLPQYPESYAALCGARRSSVALCQAAEARGYSPDLCSYARTDLGSLFAPGEAPLGGLPRPDLLIACNNICGTVTKWWEHLAYHLGVPFFLLDTPFSATFRPAHLQSYVERQVHELIEFIQRHTGRRYKERTFRRVAERSARTVQLWNDCLELCAVRPTPLSCADRFVAMAPVVALRGTQGALRFYRQLKQEVARRVEQGIGAVRDEQYRLLWDNIAIWHDLYALFNHCAQQAVSFPVDTYTSAWTGKLAGDAGLSEVARIYSAIYLNQGMSAKVQLMARMIQRFQLDGFVLHSNRSCKPYSLGQLVIKEELSQLTGCPGLIIEADMNDARNYQQSRVYEQITAFVESLSPASIHWQ